MKFLSISLSVSCVQSFWTKISFDRLNKDISHNFVLKIVKFLEPRCSFPFQFSSDTFLKLVPQFPNRRIPFDRKKLQSLRFHSTARYLENRPTSRTDKESTDHDPETLSNTRATLALPSANVSAFANLYIFIPPCGENVPLLRGEVKTLARDSRTVSSVWKLRWKRTGASK